MYAIRSYYGQKLAQVGYNELTSKQVNPLLKFLTYFNGPIPWMIEAAAILSALVVITSYSIHYTKLYEAGGYKHD